MDMTDRAKLPDRFFFVTKCIFFAPKYIFFAHKCIFLHFFAYFLKKDLHFPILCDINTRILSINLFLQSFGESRLERVPKV